MGTETCSFSVLGIEIFMSFITGNEIVLKCHWEWGEKMFKIEAGISRYFVNGNGIS